MAAIGAGAAVLLLGGHSKERATGSAPAAVRDYAGGVRVSVPAGSLSSSSARIVVTPSPRPATAPPEGITTVGDFFDVRVVGGTLTGPIRIELPVAEPDRYRAGDTPDAPVSLLGLHFHDGRWSVLPATFDARTGRATLVVSSLSLFGLGSLVDEVRKLAKAALDGLTSGLYRDIERPRCASPPSDGFRVVDTDPGSSALIFCVDSKADGSHVVRVVNQKRYAVLVTGGEGATPGRPEASELASQLSGLITAPRQVALDPGGSVAFTIDAGVTQTRIRSEFDGLAQSITSLEVGASVLATVAGKLPFSKGKNVTKSAKQVLGLMQVASCFQQAGIDPGLLVRNLAFKITGLVKACFSGEILSDTFGTIAGAVLGGTIALFASVVSYAWSSAASLFDLVRSGAGSELIVLAEGATAPTLIPNPTPVAIPGASPVVLVVDVSGSMANDDGTGRIKIEGAKAALLNFLQGVEPGTPIGLRTYPDQGGSDCNSGAVRFAVQPRDAVEMAAEIRLLHAEGDTPTAEAMLAAADDLRRAGYARGTLVLVSDGESTCGDPCEAARQIEGSGIALQAIIVGFRISDAGRKQLQCIANATGGEYVDADDSTRLATEFDGLTRPTLAIKLDVPAEAAADVGNDPSGLVHIVATVQNTSGQVARDVVARLRFDSEAPGVAQPVLTLGNLDANSERRLDWTFRPGVLLAGKTVTFTVIASAENAVADAEQSGAVRIVDQASAQFAGPILRGRGTIAIVGDSYSAGEGAHDYLSGTDVDANRCHRSAKTYLVGEFNLPNAAVIACSGAVTNDVDHANAGNGVPSQLDQLKTFGESSGGVSAVVMTLGGNDAGFPTIVRSCLLLPVDCSKRIYTSPIPVGGSPAQEFLDEHTDKLVEHLATAYREVDDVVNARDQVERRGATAPILVLAYPIPIPESKRSCATLTLLTPTEIAFIVRFAVQLNGYVEAAVKAAHADGVPVFYVPNSEDAFLPDHTVCDKEPYARGLDSFRAAGVDWEKVVTQHVKDTLFPFWLRMPQHKAEEAWSLFNRSAQELVHPNAAGYEALTRAIVRWSLTGPAKAAETSLHGRPPAKADVATWKLSDTDLGQLGGGTTPDLQPATSYPLTLGGFAANTPVEIIVRSRPRALGTVLADAGGRLRTRVALPRDLESGRHTLELRGIAPDGSAHRVVVPFRVESGLLPSGAGLAGLAALAATLLALGAWLAAALVWRRSRAAA